MDRTELEELNERIASTGRDLARRAWLERQLTAGEEQEQVLLAKVEAAQKTLDAEQRDVDELKGLRPKALFAAMLGTKADKLDKERREALAARLRLEEAQAELDALGRQMGSMSFELETLADADGALAELLEKKAAHIAEGCGEDAEALFELVQETAARREVRREIREAVEAGDATGSALRDLGAALDDASGWAVLDTVLGFGYAEARRGAKVDRAEELVPRVQASLVAFMREIDDVDISVEADREMEALTSFADSFFEDLVNDWARQSGIKASRKRVTCALERLGAVMEELAAQFAAVQCRLDELATEREVLVERTAVDEC